MELGELFAELIRVSCECWYETSRSSVGLKLMLSTLLAGDQGLVQGNAASTSTARVRELHHQMESNLNDVFGIRYRLGISAKAVAAIWSAQLVGLVILHPTTNRR